MSILEKNPMLILSILYKTALTIFVLTSLILAIFVVYVYVVYYNPAHQQIQQYRDEGQKIFRALPNLKDASCLITIENRESNWIYKVAGESYYSDLSPTEIRIRRFSIQFFAPLIFDQQDMIDLWLRCAHEDCNTHTAKPWSEVLFKQDQTQLNRQHFAQLVAFQRSPSRFINDPAALQQNTKRLLQSAAACLN